MNNQRPSAAGITVQAPPLPAESDAAKIPLTAELGTEDREAAEILIKHLFAHERHRISGIEYAVTYRLAKGQVGGDIVDVYHFDNGNVALSIADISGKGVEAAVHAALVKFGLRCYASEGLTAERVLRSLDRAFLENNAFEQTDPFASVFFGVLDDTRRLLTYASAGHEPIVLVNPGRPAIVLPPTAPLVGIFEDQHHLFKQRNVEVMHGSLLIGTTDGITEARTAEGEFFGIEGLVAAIERNRDRSVTDVLAAIVADAEAFAGRPFQDDVAAFAMRVDDANVVPPRRR